MYREELAKVGKPDPGPMPEAPATVTFVADNPDEYWDAIAPHVQHETNIYAKWSTKAGMFLIVTLLLIQFFAVAITSRSVSSV